MIHPRSPHRPWFSTLPLVLAYVAWPLARGGQALWGWTMDPNHVDAVLLGLAGVGLAWAWATTGRPRAFRRPARLPAAMAALGVLFFVLFEYAAEPLAALRGATPYYQAARPAVYAAFGLAWVATFGPPRRSAFVLLGAILALLCLADRVWFSAMAQPPAVNPGIVDAGQASLLLLVSLCAGLPWALAGRDEFVFEDPAGPGTFIARALILFGLVACLMRPAMFLAGWVVLFLGVGKAPRRMAWAGLCAAGLLATFFVPFDRMLALAGMADFWSWKAVLYALANTPGAMLSGFPLAEPLALGVPPQLVFYFQELSGSYTFTGLTPANIDPFWLRLAASFGLGAVVAVGGLILGLAARRPSRFSAGLAALVMIGGATSPLFYDPRLGVVLAVAMATASARGARITSVDVADDDAPEPEGEDEDFDLTLNGPDKADSPEEAA